jgi:DNA repair exonuclease SbcCD ATPase subunit
MAHLQGLRQMTVRENELKAHRFKIDEKQRKLEDLNALKQHILASIDRLSRGGNGTVGVGGSDETTSERRETLQKSLDEIQGQLEQTQTELGASQKILDEQENVRDSYDRIPVAVGSQRGRSQVEHIRIVRTQRD